MSSSNKNIEVKKEKTRPIVIMLRIFAIIMLTAMLMGMAVYIL